MQSTNGDVELSVTLSTKGIQSDAKKIRQEIEKEVSKASISVESTKNTSDSIKAEKELDELYEKRLDLTSKIAVAEREANSEKLSELQKQRSEIDKQISQLEQVGKEPAVNLVDEDEERRLDDLIKKMHEKAGDSSSQGKELTEDFMPDYVVDSDMMKRAEEAEQRVLNEIKEIQKVQEDSGAAQEQLTADVLKYEEALEQSRATAKDLASDLQAFSEGKKYSEVFKTTQEDVDILSKNLESVNKKLREMNALGEDGSEKYQEMAKKAEDLSAKLQQAKGDVEELRTSGDAYAVGSDPQELAQVQRHYDLLTEKMSLMEKGTKKAGKSLTDVNRLAVLLPGSLGTSFGKMTRATQSLTKLSSSSFKELGAGLESTAGKFGELATASMSAAGTVASAAAIIGGAIVLRIVQATKEAKTGLAQLEKLLGKGLQKALRGLSGSLNLILGSFLKLGKAIGGGLLQGIRGLMSRLMSLKGVIMENINLMAKWHNGNNAVNQAMSNLTSSLDYLKTALATAFAPILTTVEPMLDSLINKLAEVATMIGMVIAKLTGATTFQKAIRKQKDYAKSLQGVGGAAKEASEQLASYDKLQVVQSKDSGGGAGGAAAEFEEVGLEAVDLSKLLDDLVDKAYEWGKALGTNLKKFLDNIPWSEIQENVNKAAKALANFINGFVEVPGLAKSVGNAIGESINTLIGFVNTFLTETHWDSVGKFIGEALMEAIRTIHWDELGQMFANLLNATFELVHYFTEIFDGKELGDKLSEMLTNFTQNLNWEEIQAAVTGVVEDLVGILNGLITPETFAEVGATLGKTIQTIFSGIGTAIDTAEWDQWGESLKTGIINMFSEIKFDEAGQSVSNLTKGLLTLLEGAVDGLLSTGSDGKDIGDKIIEFIENIDWAGISTKAVSISQKLSEGLEKVFDELENSEAYDQIINAIVDFLNEKKNWERLFKRFKNSIIRDVVIEMVWGQTKELFQGAIDSFKMAFEGIENGDELSEIGANILRGIAAGWLGWFDIFTEPIREIFEGIVNGFRDIFGIHSPATTMEDTGENIILGIVEGFKLVDFAQKMKEWWATNVAPWFSAEKWSEIANTVKSTLSQKWEEIRSEATEKWELVKTSILEKWELIKTSVGEAIELLKTTLSDKWDEIKDKAVDTFTSIKDGLKDPINGILSMIEKFINAVVSGLNGLIGKLNTMKIDVPDWATKIPGINVGSLSFNIPSLNEVALPRLAQGAVIPPNKEFMAILGDQKSGTNIETPLETMMEAFRQVLQEFGGASGNREPIVLQLSGKTVAQVVWDEERKKYRQTSSVRY